MQAIAVRNWGQASRKPIPDTPNQPKPVIKRPWLRIYEFIEASLNELPITDVVKVSDVKRAPAINMGGPGLGEGLAHIHKASDPYARQANPTLSLA